MSTTTTMSPTTAMPPTTTMPTTPTTPTAPEADAEENSQSVSRGRDYTSTGRGGIGNIYPVPLSPSAPDPENDESPPGLPGRELETDTDDRARSVGRGGVGNIRSGSRARAASLVPEGFPQTQSIVSENHASTAAYERQVIEDATKAKVVRSSGRGGAGNISGSRSRSRGPSKLDSYLASHDTEGIHSTGRGGAASLTDRQSPAPEARTPQEGDFELTGRGGRGNIHSRSTSRESRRSVSRDRLSKIWKKVAHGGGGAGDTTAPHPYPRDIEETQEPRAAGSSE
ncbi:hypothetical protein BDW22DRAFT_314331 [Trametopsis cervina]|nr:hypothetical protein BDW22DRAFT_314331 [Trametopsis cervina]